ncbi:MAG: flagellar biosynthetic protein FliR [Calditrichia bacterium]
MNYTEYQILLFFLILVRFTSMFAAAPIFGENGIPNILKLGLGGALSLLLFPVVEPSVPDFELNALTALILVAGEVLTGLTIGLIIKFLFAGVELAGEYIGVDMGLSMAQEFDPLFEQRISVIARFKNILAILIFIVIDGHHFLIQAAAHSFRLLPIGTWSMPSVVITKIIKISASVFVIGVKIAAPAIVALFLTSVAMGLTARAVPQMNIFFVGFPLRISVGFISLIMAFPLFIYVFQKLLTEFESNLIYLLRVM